MDEYSSTRIFVHKVKQPFKRTEHIQHNKPTQQHAMATDGVADVYTSFAAGEYVQLRGLKAKRHNEKVGVVVGPADTPAGEEETSAAEVEEVWGKGRRPVKLADGTVLCVRPENIVGAPFTVVSVGEDKGLGAVATRDIVAGERLLVDPPLFVAQDAGDINREVGKLTKTRRDAFFMLKDSHYFDNPTACSVFRTNALPLGAGSATSAIFLVAARFNHSCLPNVHHSWNANLNAETIHACRDIKAGEELYTCYVAWLERHICTREERQMHLHAHFNFLCRCEVCSLSKSTDIDLSDKRRHAAAVMHDRIYELISSGRFMEGVVMVEQLLNHLWLRR